MAIGQRPIAEAVLTGRQPALDLEAGPGPTSGDGSADKNIPASAVWGFMAESARLRKTVVEVGSNDVDDLAP